MHNLQYLSQVLVHVIAIFRSDPWTPYSYDACNLRLLGLRATIEVLKQPPVIAKQERAGEGD